MPRRRPNLFSLIIPVFKEGKRIFNNLTSILEDLKSFPYPYEVIVVVDGKVDDSFKEAKRVKSPFLKVVGYEVNHGKGYAIRYGMAKSNGDVVGFLDAGGDISVKSLPMMIEEFVWNNADAIIASKRHPLSRVNFPFRRRIMSWGYQKLVKLLFNLDVKDTQVGMKIYRRKVLGDVFPRLLVKKFAFDIEMLAVAHHLGYTRIFEAPVELNFDGASTIRSLKLWKTIFNMLWDTAAVFYRLKIIKYYDNSNKRRWIYDKDLNFRINIG